jgi:cytochrome c peroxidase
MRAGIVGTGALLLVACGDTGGAAPSGSPEQEGNAFTGLSPETLPPAPPDASNRFADDPAAAQLGQRFFFDTGFAGQLLDEDNDGGSGTLGVRGESGKIACASCHVPEAGFVDVRTFRKQLSLAAGWGVRKARMLLDVGQSTLLMWDGRRDALYNQPFTPIETHFEMNSSRLFVAQELFRRYRADYEALFGAMPPLDDAERFPQLSGATTGCPLEENPDGVPVSCHGMPGDAAEYDAMSPEDREAVTLVVVNFGKAIGAYERLLSCGPSRFDAWVHGDADALTAEEQLGAELFVGRAKCASCHSGPFLTDQSFHNVGLQAASASLQEAYPDDPGAAEGLGAALEDPLNVRGPFSDGDDERLPDGVDAAMTGAFRTPSLRCVSRRPSFMHTAQYRSLGDVVSFFAKGGHQDGYLGTKEIQPLDLAKEERAALVAFLEALDGPGPAPELLVAP